MTSLPVTALPHSDVTTCPVPPIPPLPPDPRACLVRYRAPQSMQEGRDHEPVGCKRTIAYASTSARMRARRRVCEHVGAYASTSARMRARRRIERLALGLADRRTPPPDPHVQVRAGHQGQALLGHRQQLHRRHPEAPPGGAACDYVSVVILLCVAGGNTCKPVTCPRPSG